MRIKELVSETAVYGFSHVIARFLNYFLVPFYTDVFAQDEYGVISVLYSSIMFFNILFSFGMESAYLRYGRESNLKHTYSSVLILVTVSCVFGGTLLYFASPFFEQMFTSEFPNSSELWQYLVAIIVLDAIMAIPLAELRLAQRAWTFSALRLGHVVINVALNFYLILSLNMGIEAILYSNIIASALICFASLLVTISRMTWGFSRISIETALKFGLPYLPAGLGYLVNETIDRFFISGLSAETVSMIYGAGINPLEVTGVYSACYKLSIFMTLGVQMFRMAWQPFFLRYKNESTAPIIFRKVFIYFNISASLVFALISLFRNEIVALNVPILNVPIINEGYWWGLYVVPVLLMANWFQGWYVNFTAGIFITENTKKMPIVTLTGAAATILLLSIFVPRFGMMAAALTTLFTYGLMAVFLWHFSTKFYPVNYPILATSILMLFSFVIVWLPDMSDFVDWTFGLKLALFFLLALVSWIYSRYTLIESLS